MKKASFYTLGCKVNYNETEALKELFRRAGYEVVGQGEQVQACIINTCTVTHLASRKSRQFIRRARRSSPDAILVVTGCLPQVEVNEIKNIQGVDLICGTYHRHNLPQMVDDIKEKREQGENDYSINIVKDYEAGHSVFENIAPGAVQERTRAFIKVQEGCDRLCSYCIVPLARGPSRSALVEDVLDEVNGAASRGCLEIVLTGVHLGMYQDPSGKGGLEALLSRIEKIPEIIRVRLSSIEPTDITDKLLEVVTCSQKICPHLHIPLQSGSDSILERMNRPYRVKYFSELLYNLRQRVPDIAISSDVMVGFPGESDEEHQESCRFVKEAGFSRLHIFPYSPRPGTPAASYPQQVSPETKEKRRREMMQIGELLEDQHKRSFLGTVQDVLVEKKISSDRITEGLTGHYLRVRLKMGMDTDSVPQVGSLIPVKLEIIKDGLIQGLLWS